MAMQVHPLRWGVDTAGHPEHIEERPWAARLLKEFGFDLWMDHYSPQPTVAGNIGALQTLDAFAAANGIRWMANLESANWSQGFADDRGREWYHKPDGRYYFQFPEDLLETLDSCQALQGLMYDEAEHMQNCSNGIARNNKPWIYNPAGQTLLSAAEGFEAAVGEVARLHQRYGIRLYSEHVFPVLFHSFARAGWTACSKVLKENWTPAFIACALGAAKQYGTELWLTPDFWWMMDCPGHSPEQYRSALLLAYHMGADCIYTENLAWYAETQHPTWGPTLIDADENSYRVAPLGEVARWFRQEYVPAHPRDYSFEQIQPRVAIIRQPDACWGQGSGWLPDTLFGSAAWHSDSITEGWLRIWHLLSRGVIPATTLSWNANYGRHDDPFQVFCPLDGVVVYDHRVQAPLLAGVEVIFLTGIGISQQTLQAVEQRVQDGVMCIALPHLVPEGVRCAAGENGELGEGSGRWITTTDFLAPHVRRAVQPILPAYDTIRYHFGAREVQFKMVGNNPDHLEVQVS
ncbi:MAG: hypothetical protein LLG44_00110 [Chloroflexi bacterium]|nr:hypothetical protein [Chloroflexota bacterium]